MGERKEVAQFSGYEERGKGNIVAVFNDLTRGFVLKKPNLKMRLDNLKRLKQPHNQTLAALAGFPNKL